MSVAPIMWEKPYAAAVSEEFFNTICHACFREGDLEFCPHCNTTPYCSAGTVAEECREYDEDTGSHSRECNLYQHIPDEQLAIIKGLRYARFHARVLSRQRRDAGIGRDDDVSDFPFVSTKWRNMADLLSHADKIAPEAQDELRWMYRKFQAYFSFAGEEEFVQSYGILQTNSFGVTRYTIYGERQMLGCAIYLQTSRLNHACIPDIRVSFHQGNRIILTPKRAIDIKKTPLDAYTICYSANSCICTTEERRKTLKEEKHFICECTQCNDEQMDLVKRQGLAELCPTCAEKEPTSKQNDSLLSKAKRLALREGNAMCVECGYSRALVKEQSAAIKEGKKAFDRFRESVAKDEETSYKDWNEIIRKLEEIFDPLRYTNIIRMREALTDTIWEDWEFKISNAGMGRDIFEDQAAKLLQTYTYFNVFTSEYPSLLAKLAFVAKEKGNKEKAIDYYRRAKALWENVVDGSSNNCILDLEEAINETQQL